MSIRKVTCNAVFLGVSVLLGGCLETTQALLLPTKTNASNASSLPPSAGALPAPARDTGGSALKKESAVANQKDQTFNAGSNTGKTSDITGLVGKTVTPPPLAKGANGYQTSFTNDYFDCGSEPNSWRNGNTELILLRKGMRSKCTGPHLVAAIVITSNDRKSFQFLETVEINIPKDYQLVMGECNGASLAITKFSRTSIYSNRHLKAWQIVGNHFSTVLNTATVRCMLVDDD